MDLVATVLHCNNCSAGSSSDTAAVVAAIASAVAALITLGVAYATFRTADATGKAAAATEEATQATREAAAATKQAAQASAAEATATRELVELGRDQMRQAQMPVVLPTGAVVITPVATAGLSQSVDHDLVLEVANVGVGPAMGVTLRLEMLDKLGNRSVAPSPPHLPASRAGVGKDQTVALRARFRALATPVLPFRINLEYTDSLARRYAVTGRYFPGPGRFSELELKAIDGNGLPVSTLGISTGGMDFVVG